MNCNTETINCEPTIIDDVCIQCGSETCEFMRLHLMIEQTEQTYRQFSECVCGWRMIEGMGQECICY